MSLQCTGKEILNFVNANVSESVVETTWSGHSVFKLRRNSQLWILFRSPALCRRLCHIMPFGLGCVIAALIG